MSKMYYLTWASQMRWFGMEPTFDAGILKKSSDISELQNYLHEEYLNCLKNEDVFQINDFERDEDWEDDFDEDECYDEEDYDENGNLIEGLEYKMYGWPEEPEELENELAYTERYTNDVQYVKLCIISDDDIHP